MEQKRISTALKITTIGIGIVLAFFFFIYVPMMGYELVDYGRDELSFLYLPCLIFSLVIGGLCYLALWRFWQVCTEIGNDNSFSRKNAMLIQWVSRYGFIVAILFFGLEITMSVFGYMNGAWLLAISFAICIALGAGIVTKCLSKLVMNAAIMKEQNDLTI